MSSDLELLPTFRAKEVVRLESGDVLARGRLEDWEVGNGPQWFWLWLSPEEAIIPTIEAEGVETTIRISSEDARFPLEVGKAYPWLHSYWQAYHVTMIRRGEWRAREFEADDAIHFQLNGAHGWTRADWGVPDGATEGVLEEGGWDHEHCEICNAHIGRGGSANGYVDPDNRWLCPTCYERWAEPRDLGFLIGQE